MLLMRLSTIGSAWHMALGGSAAAGALKASPALLANVAACGSEAGCPAARRRLCSQLVSLRGWHNGASTVLPNRGGVRATATCGALGCTQALGGSTARGLSLAPAASLKSTQPAGRSVNGQQHALFSTARRSRWRYEPRSIPRHTIYQ